MNNVDHKTYKAAFSSGAGEAVLQELASKFHDVNSFDADPYKNAYNAGQRSVFLYILAMLVEEDTE